MKTFIWILIIFLAVLLQASLLGPLHIWPLNLVLLLIVSSIMFGTLNHTLLLAVDGGLMIDFVTAVPDGFFALIYLATALTAYFFFNQLLSRHPSRLVMLGSVLFASLIFNLWFLAINLAFN